VAPYGLTKADLGPITAPNFLGAVLGEGTEAEQDAAITVLASDRQVAGVKELRLVADKFKRRDTGVQAVVWRDTSSGKLKRASDGVSFDPERDRIEVLFAKLDLKALQAQPAKDPNPLTEGSRAWVANIAREEKQDPKGLQPGQGLAGPLGGSGDVKSGNVFPVTRRAKDKIGEYESGLIALVRTLESSPTIPVLVVYRYPDGRSRIPSKIQYYYAIERSLSGGIEGENK
jgi:hypothetical protein